jgi:hypothetical protein
MGAFCIEFCRTAVHENAQELAEKLGVQNVSETGFDGSGIAVGADVVPSDPAMNGCKVHVVVEEHGEAKVDPIVIDDLLGLPVGVVGAQRSPVSVL